METRNQTRLWIIDHVISEILGQRLPSMRQALQLFFHYRKNNTIHESAGLVADNILHFWDRARIPTKQRHHVIAHIEKLFEQYSKLKKNKGRQTDT